MAQRLRVLLRARGFVGRKLSETGDARRLLVVRSGKLADLGFQRAEQLEQLALAVFADIVRAADFRLNLAQIAFVHTSKVFIAGKSASAFTNGRPAAEPVAPVPRFLNTRRQWDRCHPPRERGRVRRRRSPHSPWPRARRNSCLPPPFGRG